MKEYMFWFGQRVRTNGLSMHLISWDSDYQAFLSHHCGIQRPPQCCLVSACKIVLKSCSPSRANDCRDQDIFCWHQRMHACMILCGVWSPPYAKYSKVFSWSSVTVSRVVRGAVTFQSSGFLAVKAWPNLCGCSCGKPVFSTLRRISGLHISLGQSTKSCSACRISSWTCHTFQCAWSFHSYLRDETL